MHIRLSAMSPDEIVGSFANDLAADLIDQGMNANTVAHVKEAAGVIMELLGAMPSAGRRRKANDGPRMVDPAKQAARQARRDARRAAEQAKPATTAIVDPEDIEPREDTSHVTSMPTDDRGRHYFGFVRHAGTPQDATGNAGSTDTTETRGDGSEAGDAEARRLAA